MVILFSVEYVNFGKNLIPLDLARLLFVYLSSKPDMLSGT